MDARSRAAPRARCCRALLLACLCAAASRPGTARAYRPFDGTDADVSAHGEFELEAGPLGYLDTGAADGFVVPALVLNYGIWPRVELVAQSLVFVQRAPVPTGPRAVPGDTGIFVKVLVRRGSLQGGRGPSLAVEVGPLLPAIVPALQLGASAAVIASMHWDALALHANYEVRLGNTAGQVPGARLYLLQEASLILEGPGAWWVRPVAELLLDFTSRDIEATSLLAGALWPVRAGLTVDLAVRLARAPVQRNIEARAGVTWSIGGAQGAPP